MEEIVGGCGSGCPARLGFPSTSAVSSRHKKIGIIGIIGRQSLARREKKGDTELFCGGNLWIDGGKERGQLNLLWCGNLWIGGKEGYTLNLFGWIVVESDFGTSNGPDNLPTKL